jgi:hypothetical protein
MQQPEQTGMTAGELEKLLGLAHQVVTWTTQDTLKSVSAGRGHLIEARQAYYKARIELWAAHGIPLGAGQTGGCTCGFGRDHVVRDDCMYHLAARLQPWNHRIPWNCPTYYDGCNCEPGPFDQL